VLVRDGVSGVYTRHLFAGRTRHRTPLCQRRSSNGQRSPHKLRRAVVARLLKIPHGKITFASLKQRKADRYTRPRAVKSAVKTRPIDPCARRQGTRAQVAARFVSAAMALRAWLLNQPVVTSKILPAIPRPIRWGLRKIYFAPVDWADPRTRSKGRLVPPRTKIFTGSVEAYEHSGTMLVERLVELECLRPDSDVLDVGSGMGRLGAALTRYLDEQGSYEGIEIVASGVEWCTENITARFPNFRFTLADVLNGEYNPGGRWLPSEYRFPFDDRSFDLAVLLSVFTHMLPPDMTHYVAEISRVLRPGGHCVATYFLLNEESKRLSASGRSVLTFKHDFGDYWTVSGKTPELSVGYAEEYVRELYEARNLFSSSEILFGGWCGREGRSGLRGRPLGDQDLVIAPR
jgi:SAM-dependent methyltransferase